MGRALIGNFKGPKGDKGDPGPQGPAGPQGPVGLVNGDGAVEFEDYTSEGAELPAPEDALAAVTSGRSLKSIFSGIRAFCKNMLDSESGSRKMIGDAFSEEQTYVAGEYAIYDNVLYKFTAAKAAGTWNPDVAAPTTIAEVVRELNGNMILDYANAVTLPIKNNISATISTKGMLFPYNFRYSGEGSPYANIHINNSHIAIVNFNSAGREMPGPFPVSPGDMVKITISGGSAEHMTSDWKLVPCKNNN